MEEIIKHRKKTAQKKYRQSQSGRGLVRFELQVKSTSKARFDALVEAAAEEYPLPWDRRRRIAKARVQVFDEMMKETLHEFIALKKQTEALKAEIKALSPSFFKNHHSNTVPIPEAVSALPDDPQSLKTVIAQLHQEKSEAQQQMRHHKRLADQFEELYNVATLYNDELKNEFNTKDPNSR